MSASYILKIPNTKACFNSTISNICIPKRERCIKPHNELVVPCDKVYNCSRMQCDPEYYLPFVKGDIIMFQTKMIDYTSPDRTMPISIFGTSVILNFIDGNNNSFGDQTSPFVSTFSGWNGYESFQNIVIDTTDFPECWAIEIKNFDDQNNLISEHCTQQYKEVHCSGSFLIESKIECGFDNSRNYYGESEGEYTGTYEFKRFSNKIRLLGALKPCTIVPEVEREEGIVTSVTIRESIELSINPFVPKFLQSYLTNVLLFTGSVCIDDVEYSLKDVSSSLIPRTNVFRYVANFEDETSVKTSCINC